MSFCIVLKLLLAPGHILLHIRFWKLLHWLHRRDSCNWDSHISRHKLLFQQRKFHCNLPNKSWCRFCCHFRRQCLRLQYSIHNWHIFRHKLVQLRLIIYSMDFGRFCHRLRIAKPNRRQCICLCMQRWILLKQSKGTLICSYYKIFKF